MNNKYTFNDAILNAKLCAADDVNEAIEDALYIYKKHHSNNPAITGDTAEQSILEIAKMLLATQTAYMTHFSRHVNVEEE